MEKRVIFHELLTPEEALERIFRHARPRPLGHEEISIWDSFGRVLAEDVYSGVDVPPFDRSAMDGYAVRAEDLYGVDELNPRVLRVVGRSDPGSWGLRALGPGEAVEISTGAPMPPGSDSVVMVEHTRRRGDLVEIYRSVPPGENVVSTGSDIMVGELVLRRCTQLGEREVGVLAAAGVERIRVFRRPRVAVISTGGELAEPGRPLEPGRIYDVNSYTISHALLKLGAEPVRLGIAGDDPEEIASMIYRGLEGFDMVILSGGTSAGLTDVTYKVLQGIGPPGVVVHGLKVRPGKPTVAAVSGSGKLVIGLPGYPSSALMIFDMIVRPVVEAMLCRSSRRSSVRAMLSLRVEGARGRRALVPVSLVDAGDHVAAYPLPSESGAIKTLAQADGYIVVPENVEFLAEGEDVEVSLFSPQYGPADLYIVGSHDLGLDLLVSMMPEVASKVISVGSLGGVRSVARGEADVAGIHLVDEKTMEYNTPFLRSYGVRNAVLVRGYMREQGIMVPRGNPMGIRGVEEIVNRGLRIVNRGRGAGTRALLDSILRRISRERGEAFEDLVKRLRGYHYEARTHTAVAAAVAQGRADAGIGIRAAAALYGLDFISLGWESYDFLVQVSRLSKKSVAMFLERLRSSEFLERLSRIPGYRAAENTGEVIWRP